ncbi:uncharacterized protein LOC115734290 [Rhodamnia argentea]|uniref:Uncharacterized protein LOC115734290 n=1 Tax=Rhodamnia argentea TaxID=178133 RepID=A0A8B8NF78_9MYRT|nr:uncharacterized protein LOC115734290 [Rhodamnia argentea]
MVHMRALNCDLFPSSRFARGLYRDTSVKRSTGDDLVYRIVRCRESRERERWRREERGGVPALRCSLSSPEEAEFGGITGLRTERRDDGGGRFEYLAKAHGWGVRRLIEDGDEMRAVARIQAQAFHEPVALFNDLFFQFFEAEVLAGLVYKLRNSPSDRYACLVAEPATSAPMLEDGVVGVVDVTVLREKAVLRHLPGAEEYLYVSGIAVSESFRRRKVATVLLEACDELCIGWGYRYLVLRAHEDDSGARTLYANAGYRVVTGDPIWVSWIGKRRRVLMIKKIG